MNGQEAINFLREQVIKNSANLYEGGGGLCFTIYLPFLLNINKLEKMFFLVEIN